MRPPRFAAAPEDLEEVLERAKQMNCPHCRQAGTLIGHGVLRGYAERGSKRVVRGRRLFCSNRFRKDGCGRTVSVLLAEFLARHVVGVRTLGRLLVAAVAGVSVRSAWQQAARGAFSVQTGYRLWWRLAKALAPLRTALCREAPPNESRARTPLGGLLDHLRQVVGHGACPFGAFQQRFQTGVFD